MYDTYQNLKKGPNNQEFVVDAKFTKFLLSQKCSKLSSFIRKSGEFLPLFIFLLSLTAVSVAALTYSMMVLKFSNCCSPNVSIFLLSVIQINIKIIDVAHQLL